MAKSYTKHTWVNNSAPAINATNLNAIEKGIGDAIDQGNAVETSLNAEIARAKAAEAAVTDYFDPIASFNAVFRGKNLGTTITDAQYADAMMDFVGSDPSRQCPIIVDPSAKSFVTELSSRGLYVKEGVNDVLDGIRKTASLFALRQIRIHRRCTGLIQELQGYAWDEKAGLIGDEKPIKARDHGPDALRYQINSLPDWRISA